MVTKNWLPLVFAPALAMDKMPGTCTCSDELQTAAQVRLALRTVCLSLKFSSANFSPYMLLPPVPLNLVKSPPCIMKLLITR